MRISDWSSDVCSSDLGFLQTAALGGKITLGGNALLLAQQIVMATDILVLDELGVVLGPGGSDLGGFLEWADQRLHGVDFRLALGDGGLQVLAFGLISRKLTDGKALCGTETDLGQTLVGVEDWRLDRKSTRLNSSH